MNNDDDFMEDMPLEIEQHYLRRLEMADLEEKDREVANIIGIDKLILLSRMMGGIPYYVPQTKKLAKNRVKSEIQKAYDGTNINKLAAEYGVSVSSVYNILRGMIMKGGKKKEAKENIPGQMNILDFTGIAPVKREKF